MRRKIIILKADCVTHYTLEHLRKARKNRYWAVVCNVFRVAIFEKWYYFSNSRVIPFSSDTSIKCFIGLLISPKRFLATLKFISSYLGLLLVFNEKKASFNLFIDSEFFSHYTVCLI